MADWTDLQRQRYARHFRLPGFGEVGQARLRRARVLVIGAGGLGSPVLQYLAAAGVGQLTLVEFDRVDLSNLQRQTIYTTAQVGTPKGEAAAAFVRALNPGVKVRLVASRFDPSLAHTLVPDHDLLIDCSDNLATRYLTNDAGVLYGKPIVYGAVHRWEGQLAVFNVSLPDGTRSAHYRHVFPQPPAPGTVEDCATAGVLGVLPGIIGSLQANEALKLLSGAGEVQHGQLFLFDANGLQLRRLRLRATPDRPVTALLADYESFCGTATGMLTVTAVEAARRVADGEAAYLDVRSEAEHAAGALTELRMTLAELPARVAELPDQELIVYCRSGQRSARVVDWLTRERPDIEAYSLAGGWQP